MSSVHVHSSLPATEKECAACLYHIKHASHLDSQARNQEI
ncbi:hypothetical protein HMPREF3034_00165 [Prevotella sp. DNF00663]|nr:hypothetical protein HMPREF3034_00165 [Prevotella sp. DNF00663]